MLTRSGTPEGAGGAAGVAGLARTEVDAGADAEGAAASGLGRLLLRTEGPGGSDLGASCQAASKPRRAATAMATALRVGPAPITTPAAAGESG